jgi:hypothetical protein
MKKVLFSFGFLALCTTVLIAQKYEEAKNLIILQQFAKAKESVDKNWSNPKYTAKPEAYILKSSVYAMLGSEQDKGEAGKALLAEAAGLYDEYLKQDPKLTLIKDPAYANTPLYVYNHFIQSGISNYNDKDYPNALNNFEKSIEYAKFLTTNGIYSIPLDTTAHLYAGSSAILIGDEKHDKIAIKHFSVLADAKMGGEYGNTVYINLARKCFDYEDMECFRKYMALGKEVYPDQEFFTYEEIDFLFGIEDEALRMKRIEKKLQEDPNNYKIQAGFGSMLFDKLNPRDLDAPLPDNSTEIEQKMVGAFEKAAQIEPSNPESYLNLGNHFMNMGTRYYNQLVDHQKMMREKQRANTPEPVKGKPAPKPPAPDPADVEKRKELQEKNEGELAKAGGYYEKAIAIFKAKGSLTGMDKQNYRGAVSNMIDINKAMKDAAIRDKKAADETKFGAAEKKYMDLYAEINKMM